jgi:hypothetical protein
LLEALAAVDETFLRSLAEINLPDCPLRDWLTGNAQSELDRRAGNAHTFPGLSMPLRELPAARGYLRHAALLCEAQRTSWNDEMFAAGRPRAFLMLNFELVFARAEVQMMQSSLTDPSDQTELKAAVASLQIGLASALASLAALVEHKYG